MKMWLGTFLALAVSSAGGTALAAPSIVITQQDIQQVKAGANAQPAAITNKDLPRDEDYRVPNLDPVAPHGKVTPGQHPQPRHRPAPVHVVAVSLSVPPPDLPVAPIQRPAAKMQVKPVVRHTILHPRPHRVFRPKRRLNLLPH